jgi:hypothetical protein
LKRYEYQAPKHLLYCELIHGEDKTWNSHFVNLCFQQDLPTLVIYGSQLAHVITPRQYSSSYLYASVLQKDILLGSVPQFAFYVPTIVNDGHDSTATWTNEYLLETWSPLLRDPRFMKNRVVIITYDENGKAQNREGPTDCTQDQPGPVYCTFLGPNVRSGKTIEKHYNHYNMLRFVENHFGLGTLGRCDEKSKPINGVLCRDIKDDNEDEKERRLAKFIRRIEKATINAAGKLGSVIPALSSATD